MSRGLIQFAIVLLFMAVALFIGIKGYRLTKREVEDYFLANRSIGTLVLLLTMFATLMSSFTFFGGPGRVYSTGMEWMLVMGIMDGFLVAILWYVIGTRQWRLGQKHRYITVGEMLEVRGWVKFRRSEGIRTRLSAVEHGTDGRWPRATRWACP